MNPSGRTRAEMAALPDQIVAFLKSAPHSTVKQIVEGTGFCDTVVRSKLKTMLAAGRVHFVSRRIKHGRGMGQFWVAGARPVGQNDCPEDERDCSPLRQNTVRAYPLNNVRDPLVAALFGPAEKEAA